MAFSVQHLLIIQNVIQFLFVSTGFFVPPPLIVTTSGMFYCVTMLSPPSICSVGENCA